MKTKQTIEILPLISKVREFMYVRNTKKYLKLHDLRNTEKYLKLHGFV